MFGMTPAQKIWHTITKSLLQRVLCTSWDICYSSRDVNLMLQFNKNLRNISKWKGDKVLSMKMGACIEILNQS
jgi:hypothetical protein